MCHNLPLLFSFDYIQEKRRKSIQLIMAFIRKLHKSKQEFFHSKIFSSTLLSWQISKLLSQKPTPYVISRHILLTNLF